MALGSTNYAHSGQRKEVKRITNRLKAHNDLMQKYIAQGMPRNEASAKAYKEIY